MVHLFKLLGNFFSWNMYSMFFFTNLLEDKDVNEEIKSCLSVFRPTAHSWDDGRYRQQ